jgi:hypothetical protein
MIILLNIFIIKSFYEIKKWILENNIRSQQYDIGAYELKRKIAF